MTDPTPVLRPAATVVLVRDGVADDGEPAIETLMLRRNDRGVFGGMWVFPGGRVDEDDADPGAPDDDLAAGRRAAVREAEEEAGLTIDPATLIPLSHWTPPLAIGSKGFATWFFVAEGSDAAVAVDGDEIHDHAWLTPTEVLRRRAVGEVALAPPTFVTLTVMSRHPTIASLLAELRSATPEHFRTQMALDGDRMTAVWHGDADYIGEPGREGGRHRLVMGQDAWSYERSVGAGASSAQPR